jgi:hypothetical protein
MRRNERDVAFRNGDGGGDSTHEGRGNFIRRDRGKRIGFKIPRRWSIDRDWCRRWSGLRKK